MNKLPNDWDAVELSNAGTWLSGGTPPTSNPAYWGGEIPWISAASLKHFDIKNSDRQVTTLGALHGTRTVSHDTVLFVVRGMSLKSEFRVGVTQREVTFGQDCKAIIPRPGIDSRFLAYSLKAHAGQILGMVDEAGHGTGRLPTNQLSKLQVGVPSAREQRKITEILDTMDESINLTERLITKLEAAFEGLIHDLVTVGIDEAGRARNFTHHANELVSTTIGTVPRSWRVGPLGSQVTLQRGFDITVAEQKAGTIPVVSSSGISSFHDKAMVHGPGVVIGRKGKLGNSYYIEGDFWPHDTSLWVKDFHGNNRRYVALLLAHMRLDRFDAATSVPTLNRNFVHPIQIAMPERSEQDRIVEYLDRRIQHLISERQVLEKLRQIRKGLMEDLLTGRVRVKVD